MADSTFGFHSTAEEVTQGIDLAGTTWLVTGVNSGIGTETARVLALRGAKVVGLARTAEKAREALDTMGGGVPVACDLADLASVRAAVATIATAGLTFDGLIANAGIMALPTLQQAGGLELQFATNHLGHFVLVTGLLDRLTPAGRVVVLSSGAHRYAAERGLELDNLSGEFEYHPWRAYGRSKLANILFARSLASRFAADGSKRTAYSVHPGVIRTNLTRHIDDVDKLLAPMKASMKNVPQGAATTLYAATADVTQHSGAYFSDCALAKTIPQGSNDALADLLWARSVELAAERS
jgi:NAD(P)-dependent dehydrogenase (short-subunit alcohol dehydrogenase family)